MRVRVLQFLTLIILCVYQVKAQVCVPSSDISITVAQKPVVSITGSTTVCNGGNAVLFATLNFGIGESCNITWEFSDDDGASWHLIPLENKAMLMLTNLTKTLSYHSIYACGGEGCDSKPSNLQKVTVINKPIVTISATNLSICENTPLTLTANVTGGTGSDAYTWYSSTNGNDFTTIVGQTNVTLTTNNLAVNTFFKVSVTELGDGCTAISQAVQINVNGCRGSIGDFAWLDCNKNGIQDAGEVGLANVPVTISGTPSDGTIFINQNSITNASGLYLFSNLKPGKYVVTFGFPNNPSGIIFTGKNRGAATVDSDVDPSGKSDIISLAPNQNITTIDAGYIDNAAPVFTSSPSDITIDCDALLVFATVSATDNINPNPAITFKDDSIALDCKLAQKFKAKYTRTWFADDGCGNISTIKQNITTRDTKPPVFNKQPADITIACETPIPDGADIFTLDACDGKIIPLFTQPYEKICASSGVYHRTFTATDGCNNVSTISHNITVVDTVAPVFLNLPTDLTLSCGSPLPDAPNILIKDNCDITATFSRDADDSIPGFCAGSYKIVRHWIAVDACGNARKGQQTISIFDNESPSIVNVPSDITVDCKNIPAPISLNVKDNCDIKLTSVFPTDKTTAGSCPSNYSIVRTWVATDACGNATQKFQRITVKDSIAPVLANVPSDITVNVGLGDAIPIATIVTATDNCDNNPKVTANEIAQIVSGNCKNTIVRTWQAKDVCGNVSAIAKQTITILDSVTAVQIASRTPANCTDANGSVSLSPANYNYTWSDNGTGNVRNDLKKGLYNVTVSKSGSCFIVLPITVDSVKCLLCTKPLVSVTRTKQTCAKGNDGTATVNITNGAVSDYNFTWSPNISTTNSAQNLSVGTNYSVRIARKDNDTCAITTQFSVDPATDVVIADAVITNADCNVATGSAKFNPTGNLKYTFKWNDLDTNSARATLAVANYTVTINDGVNCPIVKNIAITKVCDNPCVKPSLALQITNQSCAKIADGKIGIVLSGGNTNNYELKITSDVGFFKDVHLTTLSYQLSALPIANYSLHLQKESDPTCFIDTTFQILKAIDVVPPTPTIIKAICNAASGSIIFNNATNYTFAWSDGNTSASRINLIAGTYTVQIGDIASTHCPVTQTYKIDTINNLRSSYTINKQPTCALNNGSVTINALGGSGNYSYSWGSSNTRSGLSAVITTVTVTDKQTGCISATPFTLRNENILATITSDNIVNLACADGNDGRVNYTVSGKSANFAEPAKITIVETLHATSLQNGSLGAGNYTILVADATGCAVTQKSFSVVAPQKTIVSIRGENQVCSNSSILLESSISGGSANCAYQWQLSTNGGFSWNPITVNGTSNTLVVDSKNLAPLPQKTSYRLQMSCGNCNISPSNIIEVTLVPAPVVSTAILGGSSTLCAGAKFTITASVSPAQSAYSYHWQSSADGINWTNITIVETLHATSLLNGVVNGSAQYRVIVTPTTLTNCDIISDPPVKIILGDCKGKVGNFVWLDCNKNGIQDVGEKGLANVSVNLIGTDDNGLSVSLVTTTDVNGNYIFANVKSGKYNAIFSAPSGSRGLRFSPKRTGNGTNDSKVDATGKTDVFTFLPTGIIDTIDAGFIDDIKPTFTFAPLDKTIECGKPISFDISAATDNSGNKVKINSVDILNRLAVCPIKYTITRTWTATDDCGNASTISQKINVTDTTPPVIGDIPADISVDCNRVPAAPRNITATDNCDATVKVIFTEKIDSICKYTRKITRTWSAVDSCGNFAVPKSQIITTKDSIKPVITNVPTDITVNLANNETIPPIPIDIYATDNCDANPSLIPTQSPLQFVGNCTSVIKRTWKSVDACTNFNSLTQTITILDAIADVSVVSNTPEHCTTSNGRVEFSPNNYTYIWSDGGTGAVRSDLNAKDYSVTVSKDANCSIIKKITVARECTNGCISPIVTFQTTNQTCAKGNSGTVQLQITNFIAGLSYDVLVKNDKGYILDTLVKVETLQTTSLPIGNYTLRVEKLGDTTCFNTISFSIKPAQDAIIASPIITNADCNILTGSVKFVLTDTVKYKFKWNDGDTNRIRNNLVVGNYTVSVSLTNYCDAVINVPIKTTCLQTCVQPVYTIQTTNQSCAKENDGSIQISFEPSTLSYELLIKGDNGYIKATVVANSLQLIAQGLPVGNYTVRVTKSTDPTCFTEKTFIITAAKDIVVNAPQIIPASCTSPTGAIIFEPLAFNYGLRITGNNGYVLDTIVAQSSRLKAQGLLAGNYTVTVSDVSGALCPIIIPVTVPNNNPLKTTFVINSQPTCGKPNGYVTLNTTGGSGNYTYSWGEGNSRFVLFAGVTTVTATDRQTGCQTLVTFTLINQTVEATVAMDSLVNLACNGDKNARLNYKITPGAGFHFPMTVEVRDSQNNVVNNGALGAGIYVLVITDSYGCIAAKRNFSVIQPVRSTISTVIKNQTCDALGNIQLHITPNQLRITNYELRDTHGALISHASFANDTFTINLVAAGSYSLIVTDGSQCPIATNNIVINDACLCRLPVVDSIISIPATCGLSNGKATVVLRCHSFSTDVACNVSSYQYDWSPSAGIPNTDGNERINISSGVYNVLITSNTNADCYTNATVGVGSIDGPKNITYTTKPATCASSNGQVILSPAPADSLTYTWLFDASNKATRSDLKSGVYQVLVSRNTLSNCPTLINVKVESENNLKANGLVTTNPTCGANNGVVTINVSGAKNTLTYSWGNNKTRTDLKAGVYTVTVIESGSNCNAVATFTINNTLQGSVQIILKDSVVYTRCSDSKDAKIVVSCQLTVDGLRTIYDCQPSTVNHQLSTKIVDAQGNEYQNENLGVGNYCIVVLDANDCIAGSSCFEVRAPQKLSAYATETNRTCDVGGTIVLTTSGGAGLARFSWSDDISLNTQQRSNLAQGAYAVTVSDANGCTTIIDTLMIRNDCPTPTPCSTISNFEFQITPKTCTQGGAIFLNKKQNSSGIAPFAFDWLDILGTNNPQNRVDLQKGNYSVVITDAQGCKDTLKNISIADNCDTAKPCSPPQFGNISVIDSRCGKNSGIIALSYDTLALSYEIYNDSSQRIAQGSNLKVGSYTLKLISRNDSTCFSTKTVIVRNQDGLIVATPSIQSATCSAPNGLVEFSGTDAAYNYVWNDKKTGAKRSDLIAGEYTITVTDLNNAICPQVLTVTVPSVNNLSATANIVREPSCGGNDGQANIRVSNGSGNYSFSWGASNVRSNLSADNYGVTVTDNVSGCTTFSNFTLNNAVSGISEVQLPATIIYTSCANVNDASIAITLKNSPSFASPTRIKIKNEGLKELIDTVLIPPFLNSLIPSFTTQGLGAGKYTISVFDAHNCLAGSSSFEVKSPAAINLIVSTQSQTCLQLGKIILNSNVPLSYKLLAVSYELPIVSGAYSSKLIAKGLKAGNYNIIATDVRGCSITQNNIVVANDSVNCTPDGNTCTLKATAQVINKTCDANKNPILGSIAVSQTAGTAPFKYNWSIPINTATATSLNAGTYFVTVTDSKGCADTLRNIILVDKCDTSIINPNPTCTLKATAQVINKTCDANKNIILGSIAVSQTGGTAPFKYNWSIPINTATATSLNAGIYFVTVTDSKGCADTLRNIILVDKCDTVVVNPIPKIQRDTLYSSVLFGKKDTICFNVDSSTIGRATINFCGGSTISNLYFGNAQISSGNCLTYTAGAIAGNDKLCVRICNTNGNCREVTIFEEVKRDSVRAIATKSIHFDTLIYVGRSMILCFEPTASSAIITPACATRYRNLVSYKITNANGCVTLTGLSAGRDTLCFSVCRNGVCDTVTAYILVKPFITPQDTTCEKLYDGPVTLSTICGTKATLCTKLEKDDTLNYRIYDNGNRVASGFEFCAADTSVSYSYFPLLFNRPNGGWHLDEWIIGGKVHHGDFYTIQAIVDSMNVWNPTANWRLDAAALTIFTLNNNYKYGAMLWSRLGLPIAEMEPNIHLVFNKLAIPLSDGQHIVIFENTIRRCSDSVMVTVKCIPGFTKKIIDQPAISQQSTVISDKPLDKLIVDSLKLKAKIAVYNAFSPNGDGINDVFTIEGLEKYPGNVLTIYNRWGNQVFEAKDYKNNWDGTYQGAALPDGTYFWMIELPNKENSSGMVQIRR